MQIKKALEDYVDDDIKNNRSQSANSKRTPEMEQKKR